MKKQHLPSKICIVCERPFAWRLFSFPNNFKKSLKNTRQNFNLLAKLTHGNT